MAKNQSLTKTNLNPQMESFVQSYLFGRDGVRFNAAAAAREAGYSEATSANQGWGLLQRPDVQQRMARLSDRATAKAEVNADRAMVELANMTFANMADFLDADGNIDKSVFKNRRLMAAVTRLREFDLKNSRGEVTQTRREIELADKLRGLGMVFQYADLARGAEDPAVASETINEEEAMVRGFEQLERLLKTRSVAVDQMVALFRRSPEILKQIQLQLSMENE